MIKRINCKCIKTGTEIFLKPYNGQKLQVGDYIHKSDKSVYYMVKKKEFKYLPESRNLEVIVYI